MRTGSVGNPVVPKQRTTGKTLLTFSTRNVSPRSVGELN